MSEPAASTSSARSEHVWINSPLSQRGTFNRRHQRHVTISGRQAVRDISKYRHELYYVLAEESPLDSDDGAESVQSIQAKETDIVKDTSDTDTHSSSYSSDDLRNILEYEIATEAEDDDRPLNYSSGNSTDKEIITTKVISVAVLDDGDLEFADSEDSLPGAADPELCMSDYWQCVQCRNPNNNPMFRYCEKCYKVRKNFFPPRPKRKTKSRPKVKTESIYKLKEVFEQVANSTKALFNSQCSEGVQVDSGIDSVFNTQELIPSSISDLDFENIKVPLSRIENVSGEMTSSQEDVAVASASSFHRCSQIDKDATSNVCDSEIDIFRGDSDNVILGKLSNLKRKASDVDSSLRKKYPKYNILSLGSDSDTDCELENVGRINNVKLPLSQQSDGDPVVVQPLTKALSDPSLTVAGLAESGGDITKFAEDILKRESNIDKIPKKSVVKSLKKSLEEVDENNMCIVCLSEPKSGVFVHGRIAHICCCYKCALKVWIKAKRCPVCNCKVSNVLKAIVM